MLNLCTGFPMLQSCGAGGILADRGGAASNLDAVKEGAPCEDSCMPCHRPCSTRVCFPWCRRAAMRPQCCQAQRGMCMPHPSRQPMLAPVQGTPLMLAGPQPLARPPTVLQPLSARVWTTAPPAPCKLSWRLSSARWLQPGPQQMHSCSRWAAASPQPTAAHHQGACLPAVCGLGYYRPA